MGFGDISMRWTVSVAALLALSACGATMPGSGSYGAAVRQATADANGVYPGVDSSGAAADTTLNPNRPRGGAAPAGIKDVQSNLEYDSSGRLVTVPQDNRAAISDEQDFKAVSSRVSIQQDLARLAEQRAQYKVIPPEPLPSRPSSDAPNLAAYALSTSNQVGQPIYKRFNLLGSDSQARACARYTSPDLAQEAFLARGGPQRDPLGLDPDGDGFACNWNPAPFRHDTP